MTPWDLGITWKTEVVTTDRNFPALSVQFLASKVLRVVTDTVEYDLINGYLQAAIDLCERESGERIRPGTDRMYLSGFPTGWIVFPEAPVREVTGIEYVDSDGATQPYGGSPPSWVFVPAGRYGKATLEVGLGESWPSARAQANGVIVTYTVGYERERDIPANLKQGIALVVGELYKSPDLSNADGNIVNVLGLERFWRRRW